MLPLVKASDVFSWSAMGADTLVKMPKEMLPEDKNTRSVVKYQAEEALVKGNFGILPSPALSPMKRSGEYLTHTGIIMNMCRNFRISSVPQWTL